MPAVNDLPRSTAALLPRRRSPTRAIPVAARRWPRPSGRYWFQSGCSSTPPASSSHQAAADRLLWAPGPAPATGSRRSWGARWRRRWRSPGIWSALKVARSWAAAWKVVNERADGGMGPLLARHLHGLGHVREGLRSIRSDQSLKKVVSSRSVPVIFSINQPSHGSACQRLRAQAEDLIEDGTDRIEARGENLDNVGEASDRRGAQFTPWAR